MFFFEAARALTTKQAGFFLQTGSVQLLTGEVLGTLQRLPDQSVHCVVTSPPYYNLRDYGTAEWVGGTDPACDHLMPADRRQRDNSGGVYRDSFNQDGPQQARRRQYPGTCAKCGAVRIDDQVGLENTPEDYTAKLVAISREIRRVLRDDGLYWLNLGDCYASHDRGQQPPQTLRPKMDYGQSNQGFSTRTLRFVGGDNSDKRRQHNKTGTPCPPGGDYKPKDLIGVPWMVAQALRRDGWYLRSSNIWAKRTQMPESVEDRPTAAHEYIFQFAKRPHYFYDRFAVKEYMQSAPHAPGNRHLAPGKVDARHMEDRIWSASDDGRNLRNVWWFAPMPFPELHFAVFPPLLPETCIKASTSEHGNCAQCGAPWRRIVKRRGQPTSDMKANPEAYLHDPTKRKLGAGYQFWLDETPEETAGWEPTCGCDMQERKPAVVLDPFSGAGTTCLVAAQLCRHGIGIDLNPNYNEIARKRIAREGIDVVITDMRQANAGPEKTATVSNRSGRRRRRVHPAIAD